MTFAVGPEHNVVAAVAGVRHLDEPSSVGREAGFVSFVEATFAGLILLPFAVEQFVDTAVAPLEGFESWSFAG